MLVTAYPDGIAVDGIAEGQDALDLPTVLRHAQAAQQRLAGDGAMSEAISPAAPSRPPSPPKQPRLRLHVSCACGTSTLPWRFSDVLYSGYIKCATCGEMPRPSC